MPLTHLYCLSEFIFDSLFTDDSIYTFTSYSPWSGPDHFPCDERIYFPLVAINSREFQNYIL